MSRLLARHLGFLVLAMGLWGLYMAAGLPCPILALTGVPCPACGVTRALLALLRGDLAAYWHYQPMAVPLTLSVPVAIHLPRLKRLRRPAGVFLGLTLAANLTVYLLRI